MSHYVEVCYKRYAIPEILNWEDYDRVKLLQCDCKALDTINMVNKPHSGVFAVGYANTDDGLMCCYVCPHCGARLRMHLYSWSFAIFHDEWLVKPEAPAKSNITT